VRLTAIDIDVYNVRVYGINARVTMGKPPLHLLDLGVSTRLDRGSQMFWSPIMPYLLDSCVVGGGGGHVGMEIAV
jgi:hypothetical protein